MKAPVRFGMIGCGAIAYWAHVRALRSLRGARVVALADPDPAALARIRRFTNADAHCDARQLLDRDDVDAVIIATPSHLHASLAMDAVAAGKHIYLEKPIATSLDEAAALVDIVRRSGVHAATGFNRRQHPLYLQAREIIKGGALGKVLSVLCTFCEPADTMPDWKRRRAFGGGALLDLASHHLDLLRWLLDDEIASIEAGVRAHSTEGDHVWLRVQMKQVVEAQGLFSFVAGPADFMEFLCEGGTLRLDRHRHWLSLSVPRRFGYGLRKCFPVPPAAVISLRARRLLRPSHDSSYRRHLKAFIRLVQGQSSEVASIEDGLRSLEAVLAAEDSARRGGAVAIRREAASCVS